MPLLSADDIHVEYGKLRAVQGVGISIEEGEIVSVIGPNGAGKSSLLGSLLGLSPVTRGTVRFEGVDISDWPAPRRVKSGVALVPEGRRILVSLTVEENLLMGAHHRSDWGGVADDLSWIYQRFPNLLARKHMPGSVLSGGEQQMLAIGRAIMARPKLMLLDEPSLGLSPLFVEEVFRIIAELNGRGIAMLLVEQNTALAIRCSRRSYVLNLGVVTKSGPSSEMDHAEDPMASYIANKFVPGERASESLSASSS